MIYKIIEKSLEEIVGMKTSEIQQVLDKRLEEKSGKPVKNGKLVIGPAGENLVLYSAIVSNERVAGRGGTGAVMGWKNIKAITACGNHQVKVFSPDKMNFKILGFCFFI